MNKTTAAQIEEARAYKNMGFEFWLGRHAVPWSYDDGILLSQLTEHPELGQIRVQGMDGDTADRYIRDIRASKVGKKYKSPFPAIIVWNIYDDKMVVIDGLHRADAYKRVGHEPFDAYVIPQGFVSDEADALIKLRVLQQSANNLHGKSTSHAERLLQGVYAVMHDNKSSAEASRYLGISDQKLQSHVRVAKMKEQLSKQTTLDPSRYDDKMWPISKMNLLSPLDDNYHFMAEAINFINTAKLNTDAQQIKNLVQEIKQAQSDVSPVDRVNAVLREWNARYQDIIIMSNNGEEVTAITQSPFTRLSKRIVSLATLLKQCDEDTTYENVLSPKRRKGYREDFQNLINNLEVLIEEKLNTND